MNKMFIILALNLVCGSSLLADQAPNYMTLEQMMLKTEQELVELAKLHAHVKQEFERARQAYQNKIDERDKQVWQLQEQIHTLVHEHMQERTKQDQILREKNSLKDTYEHEINHYNRRLADYKALKEKNDEIEDCVKKLSKSISSLEQRIAELRVQEQKNKHDAEHEERFFKSLKDKTYHQKVTYANNHLQQCVSKLKLELTHLTAEQEQLSLNLHHALQDTANLKASYIVSREQRMYLVSELHAQGLSTQTYTQLSQASKELLEVFYQWSLSSDVSNTKLLRVALDNVYAKYGSTPIELLNQVREVSGLLENPGVKQALADEIVYQERGFCTKHPVWATALAAGIVQGVLVLLSIV